MNPPPVTLRLQANADGVAAVVNTGTIAVDKFAAAAARLQAETRRAARTTRDLASNSGTVASEAAKAAAAIDRQTDSVRRQAAVASSSHSAQIAALQAQGRAADQALKSVPQQASAQATKRATDEAYASLRQLHQLTQRVPADQDKVNLAQLRGAKSAGELKQAYRQMPAQITDIVTSLVSGQPAYMVAIQQGGQLRDSFGGIGIALRALASVITPTVLLMGGLALGAGVVAKAVNDVQRENNEFAKSIILTGNASGETIDQLNESARAIDGFVGTRGKAAQVLAQIAATGKVGVGQLQDAAQVAIQLQRSVGISAEETVKQFAELGDKPTEAVKRLNEQYHFLTASTYAQIRALEEQGNKAASGALAQSTFSEEMASRAKEAEKSLGILQRAARGTGDFFKEMWDAVLDVGREKTLQEKMDQLKERLKGIPQAFPVDGGGGPLAPPPTGKERDSIIAQMGRNQDQQIYQRFLAQQQADQKTADARSIEVEDRKAVEAAQARARAASNEEATRAAQAEARISAIRRDLGAESAAYANQESLLEAQRAAGLVSATAYYQQRRALIDAAANTQVKALEAENAALRNQTAATNAEIAKARAAVDATRERGGADYEAATRRLDQAQGKALSTRLEAESRIKDNAAEIVRLQKEQVAQGAVLALQGQDASRQDAETLRSQQAPERYLESLAAETRLLGMTDEARMRYTRGMQVEQEMRQAINEANKNGAHISLEEAAALLAQARAASNYSVAAEKAAAQSRQWADVWVSAVDRGADAWADFTARGLKDFKKLSGDLKDTAKQLMRDLVKTFLSQNLVKPLQDQIMGLLNGNGFAAGGQGGAGLSGLLNTAGGFLKNFFGGGSTAARGAAAGASLVPIAAGAQSAGAAASSIPGGSMLAHSGLGTLFAGLSGGVMGAQMARGSDTLGQGLAIGSGVVGGLSLAGAGLAASAAVAGGATLGASLAAGLAAVPVAGWIAIGALAINKLTGGGLFGTGWKTTSSSRSLSVGADGVGGEQVVNQSRKKSLFRGTKHRSDTTDLDADVVNSLNTLYDGIGNGLRESARILGVQTPALISGAFRQEFDKKGNLTKEFSTIAGRVYEEGQEAFATRLQAENLLNVAGRRGDAAEINSIAEQYRGNAENLQDFAAFMVGVQADIAHATQLWSATGQGALTRVTALFENLQRTGESLADTYLRVTSAARDYGSFISGIESELRTRDLTASQRAALQIETTYRQQVDQANALARAAGLAGARVQDLTRIEQLRAARLADLTQQIKDQAAGIVDGLSISDLSPLKDSQKLTKSMDDLRVAVAHGDVNGAQQLAQSALGFGRNLYASGRDYQEVYDSVTQLLEQMGLPSLDTADGTTMGDLADILTDLPQQIGTAVVDAMLSPTVQAPSTPPRVTAQSADAQAQQEIKGLLSSILQQLRGNQQQQSVRSLEATLAGRGG